MPFVERQPFAEATGVLTAGRSVNACLTNGSHSVRFSIVDSLFGQSNHLGKEKERTNHGKISKKEGLRTPSPREEQEGRPALGQRPSQASRQAHGAQVSRPAQGQGRLKRTRAQQKRQGSRATSGP